MGRSGVTTCNSVTYENMKFYETWKSDRPLLEGVILEIAKKKFFSDQSFTRRGGVIVLFSWHEFCISLFQEEFYQFCEFYMKRESGME